MNRFDIAARAALFLLGKGKTIFGFWSGKMTRQEQLDTFGFYLGSGTIAIDGEEDSISHCREEICGRPTVTHQIDLTKPIEVEVTRREAFGGGFYKVAFLGVGDAMAFAKEEVKWEGTRRVYCAALSFDAHGDFIFRA